MRRLQVGLVVSFGGLVAAIAVAFVMLDRTADAAAWRAHAFYVLGIIDQCRVEVAQAQSAETLAHVASSSSSSASPYKDNLRASLERLRHATRDSVDQTTVVNGMMSLLAQSESNWVALQDGLRTMTLAEQAQLERRTDALTRTLRTSLAAVAASGVLAVALIVLAFATNRREAAARLRVQQQREEAERRQNRYLDAIIDNIPNMVFVKEAKELRFVRFNKAGEELLQQPRDALLGKNDFDFFPKEQAAFFQQKDRETLRNKVLVDIPEEAITTPRGERWLHTRKVPLIGDDGHAEFLLGVSEDITEQRVATQARMASEARFRDIFLQTSEAIVVTHPVTREIFSVNPAACKLFGVTEAEFVGRNSLALVDTTDPRLKEATATREQSGQVHTELRMFRNDGTPFDAEVSATTHRGADGVERVTSIIRDVTAQRQHEKSLIQARQNAEAATRELEAFSYSVSHDLRAPLRAVDGFSQALLEDHGATLAPDARALLDRVRAAVQRMAHLIDDLLNLSRVTRRDLALAEVDLSTLAHDIVRELRDLEPTRTVRVTIADGLSAIGDATLVRVLLENLLSNAWKFTARTADAAIDVGSEDVDGEPAFYVRDNGAGFDMAYQDKLFVAFQRLHAASDFPGSGIGLATVQRIARRHGGWVKAHAVPSSGATFWFTLTERSGWKGTS